MPCSCRRPIAATNGSHDLHDCGRFLPLDHHSHGERFVTDVDVRLYGFSHDDASDVDVPLVGPGEQRALLLSDVNGVADGVTLRFDDEAAAAVTDAGVAGTYRPTDVDDGLGDEFLAPVLPGPVGSSLAAFDGPEGSGPWDST